MVKPKHAMIGFLSILVLLPGAVVAQEKQHSPYFITYDHYLEEKGALEISMTPVIGRDHDLNSFVGNVIEFEYGATHWWTTEWYLDWQHTRHEGNAFTGFRWENRFRPWLEPHRINPVLYVEYEHLNGADKGLIEIVGFDSKEDLAANTNETRHEREHEIETKLILSSDIGQWNVSENLIGAKNVHGGRWEFGYSAGVSRSLAAATGRRCSFCAERFTAGLELYGGLGEWGNITFKDTSHYIAPLFRWSLPSETTFSISPGWGLTDRSVGTLFRFRVTQEFEIAEQIGKLFGKH